MKRRLIALLLTVGVALSACSGGQKSGETRRVLAMESYLADIAQNVAGDRLQVDALLPSGVDPHTLALTPHDRAAIADSQILIIQGAGLDSWLAEMLNTVSAEQQVIDVTAGLSAPPNRPGDPHFWLDPILVKQYVANIQDGLTWADPAGAEVYARNAETYDAQLEALDGWIRAQVATIPAGRRFLVTNHETLGYFADRYGFQVIGAVIPSFSSGAEPSPQEMAALAETVRASGSPAIFLEVEANPDLAQQIGQETGIQVVANLYTHFLSEPDGPAPTYIEMLKHDTSAIVAALK